MSGVDVYIKKRRSWSAVPDDILTDKSLSLQARAALAWAIGRPDGWTLRVSHWTAQVGIGDTAWRRIRRELIKRGYLQVERSRDQFGRVRWIYTVTDEPALATIRGQPTDGHPTDGDPTAGSHEGYQLNSSRGGGNKIERDKGEIRERAHPAHGSLDASLPAPAVQALSGGASPLQGKTNDGTQSGPAGGQPPEGRGEAVAGAQSTLAGMDWDASGQGVGDPVLLQAIQANQKQKGTRLPAGFVVPDIWITYARRARSDLSEAQIRDAAYNFAAYWSAKPGKEGLKLNWLTTWLTWVRRERAHADGQWRREREPRPGEIIPPKPPEYYSSEEHDRRLLEMMDKYPGLRVVGVDKEQLRARLMKAQQAREGRLPADQ